MDIFDLIEFLKMWRDNNLAGDVNLDSKVDVWDLITLLIALSEGREAILASDNMDRNSVYKELRTVCQDRGSEKNCLTNFGVRLEGQSVVSAAELVFKAVDGLHIGNLKLKVDDPAVQRRVCGLCVPAKALAVHHRDGRDGIAHHFQRHIPGALRIRADGKVEIGQCPLI